MAARRSSMTICARCGRCLSRRGRFQRTIYRPGEICQFDRLGAHRGDSGRSRPDPPGLGRARLSGLLARGRRGAGVLQGDSRTCCSGSGAVSGAWGRYRETLVWDRQAGLHAGGGRPTEAFAAFCGQLRVDWHFCDPADPQAKGVVERLQDFMERASSRAGSSRTSSTTRPSSMAGSTRGRTRGCTRRCAARPIDRLDRGARGDGAAARRRRRMSTGGGCCGSRPTPICASTPATTAWTPRLVGRRVEARITDREVLAVALDTGELACRHPRSFARHRTITALEHARTLKPNASAPRRPGAGRRGPLARRL